MNDMTLSNGVKMPQLGYGVYQVTKEECERCVLDAIRVGYRSIDTAQSYFNEEVGNAIAKCGVPREERRPEPPCLRRCKSCRWNTWISACSTSPSARAGAICLSGRS